MAIFNLMGPFLAHSHQATEEGEMMEMMKGMMGGGWMWLTGFFWLVTWVLVILVLVALLRWLWKKGGKNPKVST